MLNVTKQTRNYDKGNVMSEDSLPPAEVKNRINILLRKVDEDVKNHDYGAALDKIRKVYQFDVKNIYARAYEERILVMMLEKEREEIKIESEKKVAGEIESRVKNWIEEYQNHQTKEERARKRIEVVEIELEQKAREAAINEMMKKVQEVEERLSGQLKHVLEEERRRPIKEQPPRVNEIKLSIEGGGQVEQLKKDYDEKLRTVKEQFEKETEEKLQHERDAIREELLKSIADEHRKAKDELLRQMDEERKTIINREQTKAKDKASQAYQQLIFLMMQFNLGAQIQDPILQRMRAEFSISEDEHAKAKRGAQSHAYVTAVRDTWDTGKPTIEDSQLLENLKHLYNISDEEEKQTIKKVKADLGLPDEASVILVIDDDVAVLRFIEHTLKHSYQTVLKADNVNTALELMKQQLPGLILCDVQMPGIGGFTFYEKIQKNEYGEAVKKIPFLLMSALTDEFFIKSSKQLGIKSYLTKPFTKEQLQETVRKALV